jgi:predicted double-glycine peptidase
MKTISIPLKLQQKGSLDCGPVCVQMVLEYFGINHDFQSLKNNLLYNESGTTAFDNGSLLLDLGLSVTVVTAQPRLFSPEIISSITSKEVLQEVISKKMKQVKTVRDKDNLETFKKFLNKGGQYKLEIPNLNHLKEAIDNGQPVIALLIAQALGSKEGGYHFVVVSGYDEDSVHITNP